MQKSTLQDIVEWLVLQLYDLIDFTKQEAAKRGIVTSLYGEIFTIKTIVEGEVTLNVIDD